VRNRKWREPPALGHSLFIGRFRAASASSASGARAATRVIPSPAKITTGCDRTRSHAKDHRNPSWAPTLTFPNRLNVRFGSVAESTPESPEIMPRRGGRDTRLEDRG